MTAQRYEIIVLLAKSKAKFCIFLWVRLFRILFWHTFLIVCLCYTFSVVYVFAVFDRFTSWNFFCILFLMACVALLNYCFSIIGKAVSEEVHIILKTEILQNPILFSVFLCPRVFMSFWIDIKPDCYFRIASDRYQRCFFIKRLRMWKAWIGGNFSVLWDEFLVKQQSDHLMPFQKIKTAF